MAPLMAAASISAQWAVTWARSLQIAPATPIARHRISVTATAAISNHAVICASFPA
jgi:hypothetical protein